MSCVQVPFVYNIVTFIYKQCIGSWIYTAPGIGLLGFQALPWIVFFLLCKDYLDVVKVIFLGPVTSQICIGVRQRFVYLVLASEICMLSFRDYNMRIVQSSRAMYNSLVSINTCSDCETFGLPNQCKYRTRWRMLSSSVFGLWGIRIT